MFANCGTGYIGEQVGVVLSVGIKSAYMAEFSDCFLTALTATLDMLREKGKKMHQALCLKVDTFEFYKIFFFLFKFKRFI